MSHFLLLVTGENLSEQLQPFHEYECTGTDDQYVVDVDITEDARAQYERDPATLVIKLPSGEKVYAFENGDYKPEFAKFKADRGLSLPEGYEQLLDEPAKDYQSIGDWTSEWYGIPVITDMADREEGGGYCLINKDGNLIKACKYTNPNAKWDWWVEGGRYAGRILTKSGALVNQARKGDIDFDTMRNRAAVLAEVDYDSAQRIIAGRTFVPWPQVHKDYEGRFDEGRAFYHAQPVIQDWQSDDKRRWDNPEDYLIDRDAFVELARKKAFSTFAVLHEGKWTERGQMGWFGCVSDDKGNDWYEGYGALIDGLSDDTLITFVDCHI